VWVNDTVLRLSSWVSPLGWPESKVTILFWPRNRHRVVACSCQAALKKLVAHSIRVWLKCSWIVIKIHCRITEEQGGRTVKTFVSCRCAATLQKSRRITESDNGISPCVELCKVYAYTCLSGISRAALQCSRLPWNSQMGQRHRYYC